MTLQRSQRRDLMILLCRIAKADGRVVSAERAQLLDALARIGQDAVTPEELERWLRQGPPPVMAALPAEARQVFSDEAMAIVSADEDVDPEEMQSVREALNHYFTKLEDEPLS